VAVVIITAQAVEKSTSVGSNRFACRISLDAFVLLTEYARLMPRHIRPLRWLLLATALALFTASPAYPWGSKGHEIVAAIAETQLTDAARKRIKELLPQGTTLADASTWPDKAGRQIPDMDPYHFVNFPRHANTYDQAA
jgi:hypothetical protein